MGQGQISIKVANGILTTGFTEHKHGGGGGLVKVGRDGSQAG